MRRNGIDKLAFLVVLAAAALVVLAAAGTGPAYSDSRTDPAEMHRLSAAKTPSSEVIPADTQAEPMVQKPSEAAVIVDQEGYEWSGSRSADQRYLWSHRAD